MSALCQTTSLMLSRLLWMHVSRKRIGARAAPSVGVTHVSSIVSNAQKQCELRNVHFVYFFLTIMRNLSHSIA